ncbi:tellurite resistance TerB family protein [Roseovarius salis]|uniref:tellurite resistance TerB family protein n=1 Tax=Roseovarius salis TaxID=3376063 RepID=UPI0037CAB4E9
MDAKALLTRLAHAFSARQPVPLPEPDERLALGALMVRVALSDHAYDLAEIRRIDRLLSRLYGLGPVDAAKMRATAEKLERQAPETERFAHLIRETVRFEARLEALEALWEVVLADGMASASELRVIEEARESLGLSETDSLAARETAERS